MKKAIMAFLLAAVLLQMVAMKAGAVCPAVACTSNLQCMSPCVCGVSLKCCEPYDTPCDPTNNNCCEGLTCKEVTPGVFKCKEECEDHPTHECYPGLYECCPDSGLSCVQVSTGVYECQVPK